jgi:dipeptidyl aminopeptidase/acylaminoacyl peptidase
MNTRLKLSTIVSVLICLIASFHSSLFAQEKSAAPSRAAQILDSMPHAKRISDVALSPDGAQVAYIVDEKLSVIPTTGGDAKSIAVEGNLALRDVAWSADSKRLAFIADLASDVPAAQLWIASLDGSTPTKHAELKGYVQTPRFSPDGSKLSVLFTEGLPRIAGPLEPMTPLEGEIGKETYEQRIAVIDLSTDHLAQVTPPDMYIYEYEWTPDGRSWVMSAARGEGDAQWYVARIYVANAQTGEMREIYKPKLQIADPRISPDGKNVAFIEGLMSDEGSTGGEIYVVSVNGGAARSVTPRIKTSPSALMWSNPDHITFAENIDGNSGFGSLSLKSDAARNLWLGEEFAHPSGDQWMSTRTSADGKFITAMVRQSGKNPPEVWAGAIGDWQQLTSVNADIQPGWGEMRNVHWMNGTTRVQGWLMLPKDYSPNKKYPLVVTVHGGPSAACMSYFDGRFTGAFSAMGYFVLCPNPRGSYGQGEAFTQANVKDFGGGDYRDIMAGVDAIAKEYPIDTKRLGIRGHSYGGYMTMWAETQTNRFTAAVAGAGLSDWLSYYGLNDIDEWMIPFFGASVYDDPAVYAKSDPMHFVKAVKTPTLILVGDRDGEVPMEQSVEWWHALNDLHVPTKLVIYPNEGHALNKPADSRDYILRSLEWFDEWFGKVQ